MNYYLIRFLKGSGAILAMLFLQFVFTFADTTLDGYALVGFPRIFWEYGGLPHNNDINLVSLKVDVAFFLVVLIIYVFAFSNKKYLKLNC